MEANLKKPDNKNICPWCNDVIENGQLFIIDSDGDKLHMVCDAQIQDQQDYQGID